MHDSPELETPDAEVAHQIVGRFVEEGVLPRQFADRILAQLTGGGMKAGDWRALAQQALAWEMQEGDDGF